LVSPRAHEGLYLNYYVTQIGPQISAYQHRAGGVVFACAGRPGRRPWPGCRSRRTARRRGARPSCRGRPGRGDRAPEARPPDQSRRVGATAAFRPLALVLARSAPPLIRSGKRPASALRPGSASTYGASCSSSAAEVGRSALQARGDALWNGPGLL
jgi:hypothetical protein